MLNPETDPSGVNSLVESSVRPVDPMALRAAMVSFLTSANRRKKAQAIFFRPFSEPVFVSHHYA